MVDFGKAYNYWIDRHICRTRRSLGGREQEPRPRRDAPSVDSRQADTNELRNGGTGSVPNPVQVCISFPTCGTSKVGDPVRVTVSAGYNFLLIAPEAGITDKTISGSSTMRLEAVPTNYSAGCS